ncbi:MAG TPA: hypothetical protein PK323_09985 [Bacteroidia bacterium]|nr:hypothetical protein [Bacteroidia bacterium]
MKATNFKIVILEDDDFYNRVLTHFLKKNLEDLGMIKGFTVNISSYTSYRDCCLNLQKDIDIVFSDYYLNDGFSASLLVEELHKKGINCKIIIMSRLQNIQTSIAPFLNGTAEFIQKNKMSLKRCLDISEAILIERLSEFN